MNTFFEALSGKYVKVVFKAFWWTITRLLFSADRAMYDDGLTSMTRWKQEVADSETYEA